MRWAPFRPAGWLAFLESLDPALTLSLREGVRERHRQEELCILVLDLEGANKPVAYGGHTWSRDHSAGFLQGVFPRCGEVWKILTFGIYGQALKARSVSNVEEVLWHFGLPRS